MKYIYIIIILGFATHINTKINNQAQIYYMLNSEIRSNKSSIISTDKILFSLQSSYYKIAKPGQKEYYSHKLVNSGDIGIFLNAPQLSSSSGRPMFLYKDNGVIGKYEASVDTIITNDLFLDKQEETDLLFQVNMPSVLFNQGYLETNTIKFSVKTNSIPAPFSPSVLLYMKSIQNIALIGRPVVVKYATDKISKVKIFDGTGILRDLDTIIKFKLNLIPKNSSKVYLLYKIRNNIHHWRSSSPDINKIKCIRRQNEWKAVIPVNNSESRDSYVVEFAFKINGVLCCYYDLMGWRYKVKKISKEQGYTVILNNIINPVNNEETHIVYYLTNPGKAKISLFDITGGLIRILHDGHVSQGKSIISWNGRNKYGEVVSNGLYIIEIDTEEYHEIKKVVIKK